MQLNANVLEYHVFYGYMSPLNCHEKVWRLTKHHLVLLNCLINLQAAEGHCPHRGEIKFLNSRLP